jgi:hypothetical protein
MNVIPKISILMNEKADTVRNLKCVTAYEILVLE